MTRGVSIVIPSWNGLDLLKRFLPSVIGATIRYTTQFGAPTEIIIVDDGSVDESVTWLLGQGFVDVCEGKRGDAPESRRNGALLDSNNNTSQPALMVIRNESNRGFGETCNRGFAAATHPLVFLLNNDVDVDLNSIATLVENFNHDLVFAVHCRVIELSSGHECGTGKLGAFARGFIRVHKSYVPRPAGESESVQGPAQGSRGPFYSMFAGGGSAMFDRKRFVEIGGFEPLLSPFYWEDVELSYRAWKRGYTVLYEPRSVTRHQVSSTIGNLDRHRVRKIEQRNRLIYHWIHLHERSSLASHILWVLLLAVTSPLRLKPSFIASFFAALTRLSQIGKRRREERQAARRSDRDVFDIFATLERRTDVFAYDDYSELEALQSGTGKRDPTR